MASVRTHDKWFIDKSSEKIYKVIWMNDKTVLLEGYDSVQILTSIQMLKTYYKPLKTVISGIPSFFSPESQKRRDK